ncbi:MAG: hypothetical protein V4735_02575 [Pseudomonadota bacterium]
MTRVVTTLGGNALVRSGYKAAAMVCDPCGIGTGGTPYYKAADGVLYGSFAAMVADGKATCTRASTGYAMTREGTLVGFASGVARESNNGLLVETATANRLVQSQTLDSASWTKQGSTTITADSMIAPDGTMTADVVNSFASGQGVLQSGACAANTVYTMSAYVCAAGANAATSILLRDAGGTSGHQVSVNPVTGVVSAPVNVTSYGSIALANGWFRVWVTYTTDVGQTTFMLNPQLNQTPGSSLSWGMWGLQVETGMVAASYVTTTTAAATRPADLLIVTGLTATLANPFTMMVDVDMAAFDAASRSFLQVHDGGNNNRVLAVRTSADAVSVIVTAGGVAQGTAQLINGYTGARRVKVAAVLDVASYISAIDAVLGTTQTGITRPTGMSVCTLAANGTGSVGLRGYVRRAVIWPSILADSQLSALTV